MLAEEDVWAVLMDESKVSNSKDTQVVQERPDPLAQAK